MDPSHKKRLLVVSHPCVVEANQDVYVELGELGFEVHLVVPRRWSHEYAAKPFVPTFRAELRPHARRLSVVAAPHPLRHAYRARLSAVIRSVSPDFAIVEQEPFSVAGAQWGLALTRAAVPFALQHDENRRASWPLPVRMWRRALLERASFTMARSPRAAELLADVVDASRAPLIPHPIPVWAQAARPSTPRSPFTIGFAGRLVESKGLRDLVGAARLLSDVRLLIVGNGPLRQELEESGVPIELRQAASSDDMAPLYAEMDVLVLPSRTTPSWAEQFGRVLAEAAICGVPVIGSDSGEIPWVTSVLGGRTFPEGDVEALAGCLEVVRADPGPADLRRQAAVDAFSVGFVARMMRTEIVSALGARS